MKPISPTLSSLTLISALLVIALGLTGLSGWLFDSYALRSFFLSDSTMKINTALLIIGGGIMLLLLHIGKQKMATVLTVLLTVFCGLILLEHITGADFRIDNWLVKDNDTSKLQEFPGRTSALTAVSLLVLLLAVLLARTGWYFSSQLIAVIVFIFLYAVLLGHVFGEKQFYLRGRFSGMAFHTALGLLFLDTGLLFYQSPKGFMQVLTFSVKGRTGLAYLCFYFLTIAPLTVAVYRLVVDWRIFSDTAAVIFIVLIATAITILLVYLILQQMSRYTKDLKRVDQRLSIAIAAAKLGGYDLNWVTGTMLCDNQFKANFGWPADHPFNLPDMLACIHPDFVKVVQQLLNGAIENQTRYQAEYKIIWPDDSEHWVAMHGMPQYNAEGEAIAIIGVNADITFRKEAEETKDAFISIASHELKTPLTTLKSYVQLLERRTTADPFQSNALRKIDIQVNKMTSMINNFLHVSRSESSLLVLAKKQFLLNGLIQSLVEEYRVKSSGQGIVFKDSAPAKVYADEEKISQVLNNLINNAIKYSARAEPIYIVQYTDKQHIVVAVTDTGIGIDEAEIPRLFERFYRVNNKNNKHVSGFGIGLYLSAEIIELHGGNIWVNSEQGTGSTFYFSLPFNTSPSL